MYGFTSQQTHDNHIEDCRLHGIQKVVLSETDSDTVEFNSMRKAPKVPFIIYCDIESYTAKV